MTPKENEIQVRNRIRKEIQFIFFLLSNERNRSSSAINHKVFCFPSASAMSFKRRWDFGEKHLMNVCWDVKLESEGSGRDEKDNWVVHWSYHRAAAHM